MNAQGLFTLDGKQAGFTCSNCGSFWKDEKSANICCMCMFCGREPVVKGSTLCGNCRKERSERKSKELELKALETFDKAEEVFVWQYLWYVDKMYDNVEDLLDCCGDNPPEFVHPMAPVVFSGLDLSDILCQCEEQFPCFDEEFILADNLSGLDELEKAIKKFNEENEDTVIYFEPDYSKKVRVSRDGKPI